MGYTDAMEEYLRSQKDLIKSYDEEEKERESLKKSERKQLALDEAASQINNMKQIWEMRENRVHDYVFHENERLDNVIHDKVKFESEFGDEKLKEKQIFPENIEDIFEKYDLYKDNLEKVVKRTGNEKALSEYQSNTDNLRAEIAEHEKKVITRGYPDSVEALQGIQKKYEGSIYESVHKKVNELVDEQNGKQKAEQKTAYPTLEELQESAKKLAEAKEEYEKYETEVKERLGIDKIRNEISTDLLNREKLEQIDENKKAIMIGRLNELLNKQESGLHSLEDYYAEEDNLKKKQEEITKEKNNEIEKLPNTFTDLNNLDENEKQAAKDRINKLIRTETKAARPVDSVEEYLDSVQQEKEFGRKIELVKKANLSRDIIGISGVTLEEVPDLQLGENLYSAMEAYKKAVEKQKEAARLYAEINDIPETFTKLAKLKKEDSILYGYVKERIDQMIEKYPKENRFNKKLNVEVDAQNLDEYFELEKEVKELQQQYDKEEKAGNADELKKIADELNNKKNKRIVTKAKIKEWIAAENKKQTNKSTTDLKSAAKDYKKATDAVKQADKQYNSAETEYTNQAAEIKKKIISKMKEKYSAMQEENAKKKAFIKEQVIAKTKQKHHEEIEGLQKQLDKMEENHKENLKQIGRLIKDNTWNVKMTAEEKNKLTSCNEAVDKAQKEFKDKTKLLDQLLKDENESLKKDKLVADNWKREDKSYEDVKKSREENINNNKKKLENIIKEENEHNNNLKKNIDKAIKEDTDALRSSLKSEYRKAAIKNALISTLSDTADSLFDKFRDLVVGVSEGEIKASLEDKKNKRAETLKLLKDAKAAEKNLTGSAADSVVKCTLKDLERSTSDITQTLHDANQMSRTINKCNADIVQLNKEINDLESHMYEKIKENRKEIDDIFDSHKAPDMSFMTEVNSVLKNAVNEVAQNNEKLQINAVIENEVNQKNLEEIFDGDVEEYNKLKESLASIESISETTKPLFEEKNSTKIKLVIKVAEGVTNMIIRKINEVRGTASNAPIPDLDIQKTLDNINEALTKKEEKPLQSQLVEVAKLAYQRIAEVKDSLKTMNEEALLNYQIAQIKMNGNEKTEESFQTYLKSDECKNNYNNQLDAKKAFNEKELKQQKELSRNSAKLYEDAGTIVKDQIDANKREIEAQTITCQNKEIEIKKNKENLTKAREAISKEFANVVNQNKNELNRPVELSQTDLCTKRTGDKDFTFLTKLTGVEMKDLDSAFNGMSRIYINGLNAVAYYNLSEEYARASLSENEQNRNNFLKHLLECGDELQAALQEPYESENAEKSEAPRLAGQIISVENEKMMLSAVTLKGETAQVEKFNRNARRMNESFNEMRIMTAELERSKEQEKDKAVNKEMAKNEKTAEAIHRSRDFSFGR